MFQSSSWENHQLNKSNEIVSEARQILIDTKREKMQKILLEKHEQKEVRLMKTIKKQQVVIENLVIQLEKIRKNPM